MSRGDSQGAPVSLGGRTQARTRSPAESVWKPGRQRGEHLGINDKAVDRGGRRRPTPTWGEGTVPGERRAGPGRAGRPRGRLGAGYNPPGSHRLAAVGGHRSPPGTGYALQEAGRPKGGSESRALRCLGCCRAGRSAGERWPLCTGCAGKAWRAGRTAFVPSPSPPSPSGRRAGRGAGSRGAGGAGRQLAGQQVLAQTGGAAGPAADGAHTVARNVARRPLLPFPWAPLTPNKEPEGCSRVLQRQRAK